jgi:signal peptidase I
MSSAVAYEGAWLGVRGTRVATSARRRRRRIGNLVFLLIVFAGALLWATELRPQRLGGTTDYVMVQGVSMLPTYHTGDLVLVRPSLDYGVGDIVAYRVPAGDVGAGLTVIHRIVGGSATRGFVTKGDHNDAVDDWRPRSSDIEGIPWLVVPGGGGTLAFLHAPVPLGALAAAMAVMIVSYQDQTPRPSRSDRGPGSRRGRRQT